MLVDVKLIDLKLSSRKNEGQVSVILALGPCIQEVRTSQDIFPLMEDDIGRASWRDTLGVRQLVCSVATQ